MEICMQSVVKSENFTNKYSWKYIRDILRKTGHFWCDIFRYFLRRSVCQSKHNCDFKVVACRTDTIKKVKNSSAENS